MNIDLLRDLLIESIPIPAPVERPGPRKYCADWASVTNCRDGVDTWTCPWCGRTWEAPCR